MRQLFPAPYGDPWEKEATSYSFLKIFKIEDDILVSENLEILQNVRCQQLLTQYFHFTFLTTPKYQEYKPSERIILTVITDYCPQKAMLISFDLR